MDRLNRREPENLAFQKAPIVGQARPHGSSSCLPFVVGFSAGFVVAALIAAWIIG